MTSANIEKRVRLATANKQFFSMKEGKVLLAGAESRCFSSDRRKGTPSRSPRGADFLKNADARGRNRTLAHVEWREKAVWGQ